jgi:HEAT repeat protein
LDREPTEELQKRAWTIITAALKEADGRLRGLALWVLESSVLARSDSYSGKVIPLLVSAAKDKDARVRQAAVSAFARSGADAETRRLVLLRALKDRDPDVRREGGMELATFRGLTKEAVSSLLEALQSGDEELTGRVAHALTAIGSTDRAVISALVQTLQNASDLECRCVVAQSLGTLGEGARPALPALVEALQEDESLLRQAIGLALKKIDPKGKWLPVALADCLGPRKWDYQGNIRDVQEITRRVDPKVAAGLADLLKDKELSRRVGAAIALGGMGQDAREAKTALVKALKDPEPRVRLHAAFAAWKVAGQDEAAIPVLAALLKAREREIRRQAAAALGQIGPDAQDAVPALIKALQSDDQGLATMALHALNQIGPQAKTAVPALTKILKDGPSLDLRMAAVRTVKDFGREARMAVPRLLVMLKETAGPSRALVAEALGEIATAEEAGRALVEALRQADPGYKDLFLHYHLSTALQRLGPEVIADLAKLLKEKNRGVRLKAVEILREFGPAAKPALPALLQALQDKDDAVAVAVAEAVWHIGQRKETRAVLRRALKSKNSTVRQQAASILRQMGKQARDAVPSLLEAAKDSNLAVRFETIRALQNIDPEAAAKVGEPGKDSC